MTITIYSDLILPETVVQAGVRGKNMRSNTRTMSGSGYAAVNINWARTLRQYEIGIKPMEVERWLEIEALHEATDGGAYGFLMQDPKDRDATTLNGNLQGWLNSAAVGTVGVGYGIADYNLNKRYSTIDAVRTYDRRITRPKSAITVRRNGSPVTVGTAAGNISVNYNTGIVTFVRDSTSNMTSIVTGTTTVLRFSGTSFTSTFAAGGRIWLTGVTGTAATALNSVSHAITSVTANEILISTNTNGLTASSGSAFKFPQPTDTLTWSGEFYIPVHFANDDIDWEIVVAGTYSGRVVSGPNVVLQEVRE